MNKNELIDDEDFEIEIMDTNDIDLMLESDNDDKEDKIDRVLDTLIVVFATIIVMCITFAALKINNVIKSTTVSTTAYTTESSKH